MYIYEFKRSCDSSIIIAVGRGQDGLGSIPSAGNIFLFTIASILAVEPTWPLIPWVLDGALIHKG
jgi:hypothetical protein